MEKNNLENKNSQEGTATHSGWNQFYNLFSKYRDECIKIGQIVLGTNQEVSINYLRQYSSALYSMAQQIFSFYNINMEKEITNEWLDIVEQIEERIYIVSDTDYRNQLLVEGQEFVPRDLKMNLILFYNKINRLAAEADLLVGKEKKDLNEPKKGLLGL